MGLSVQDDQDGNWIRERSTQFAPQGSDNKSVDHRAKKVSIRHHTLQQNCDIGIT